MHSLRKPGVWAPPLGKAIACVLGIFLFVLLFGSNMTKTAAGLPETSVPLQDADVDTSVMDATSYFPLMRSSYTFQNIHSATRTVYVETVGSPADIASVEVQLQLVQYLADGSESIVQLDTGFLAPSGRNNALVLRMYNTTGVGTFRLVFSGHAPEFQLRQVMLNRSGFSFNFPQFFLLLFLAGCVWLVVNRRWWQVTFSAANKKHLLVLGAAVFVCLLFTGLLMNVAHGAQFPQTVEYDVDQGFAYVDANRSLRFYHQLFYSLHRGQVAVGGPPTAEFLALENPYMPAQRSGVSAPWDLAYYNGQFYVYFGPAPMLLYYAVFLLTGRVPDVTMAAALPAMAVVIFTMGALLELLRYFKLKANLLLLVLVYLATLFSSMLFVLVSSANVYEEVYVWAMLGLAGLVWLFLLGLRLRLVLRCLCWFGAGGCVVLIAASRPAVLLLALAFVLPVLLRYLFRPQVRPAHRLASTFVLAVPVLCGAALLMYYNYLRFQSPFVFGNEYQLTMWDMREQTFRWSPVWLFQALWLYLLYPLGGSTAFPFVRIGGSMLTNYGGYMMNAGAVGLVNFPFYWSLAAAGKTLRGQPLTKKAVYIGVPVAAALLLWLNYCIGGVLYRYVCDIALALGLLAGLVLLEYMSCKPPQKHKGRYLFVCGLCAASVLLGFFLCFSNERNYILKYSPDFYITMQRLFNIG